MVKKVAWISSLWVGGLIMTGGFGFEGHSSLVQVASRLGSAARIKSGVEASKPVSGQAAINEALAIVVKSTKVPLWAPKASAVHAPSLRGYLSASTLSKANQYAITLTATANAYPVNDPQIQITTGLAQLVGIFSGYRYGSIAQAKRALFKGDYVKLPASSPHQLALTKKIEANEWKQGGGTLPEGIIEWHEDGWTIEMNQTLDLPMAQKLANRIAHTRLPERQGVIAVGVAGDGAHTNVTWRSGSVVYQTFSEYLPSTAVQMAESMQPVREYNH